MYERMYRHVHRHAENRMSIHMPTRTFSQDALRRTTRDAFAHVRVPLAFEPTAVRTYAAEYGHATYQDPGLTNTSCSGGRGGTPSACEDRWDPFGVLLLLRQATVSINLFRRFFVFANAITSNRGAVRSHLVGLLTVAQPVYC